ncbi:hypothetical protein T4B_13935 [Trichinella pseudospiralis]|uniref:Uncharacterized protein n=1 Tax=Trichinella pseudospiralis TaxID=6337 RepID=A0A0V1GMM9_TRIPS|nr:hypothetical protein T4B_13935 [Trichinella pseudospiralis]
MFPVENHSAVDKIIGNLPRRKQLRSLQNCSSMSKNLRLIPQDEINHGTDTEDSMSDQRNFQQTYYRYDSLYVWLIFDL